MNISSLSNSPLNFPNKLAGNQTEASSNSGGELSFAQMVNQKIEEVNSLQKESDKLTETFLEGGPVEIHEMLISVEKADLALRETIEIRNKLIEAYQNIEKMQI